MAPRDEDPTKREIPVHATAPTIADRRDLGALTTVSGADERPVSTGATVLPGATRDGRYGAADELLGEGGMGAVFAVDDKLIGRRVAMKVLRADAANAPSLRALFLREPRVQGQLEHPAIVPVYDVGLDPTGAAYFTMKRVRGTTLSKHLDDIRHGRAPHAPRRLLNAFTSVCLAVEFAHARGVVHRDLKPSNLMLGEFGEVHVLDWGVARVLRDESSGGEALRLPDGTDPPTLDEAGDRTRAAGTPGYMAPEQTLGVSVGPAADVFALGAILYEILALRPLHTVESRGEKPLEPTGALTAELAAIVDRATRPMLEERTASARDLYEEVERWLDGERTTELRRNEAAKHLQAARAWLQDPNGAARRAALREAGRALALEPDDPAALLVLYRILADQPTTIPDEVKRELEAKQASERRLTARTSAIGYASLLLFAPVLLWVGVRDWTTLYAFLGFGLAAAALAFYNAARPEHAGARTFAVLALSTVCFSLASPMYGPAILVPTMIATNTMAFALHLGGRARAWAIAVGILGVIAPFGLAAMGVIDASYAFADGKMIVEPRMLALPALPTLAFLGVSSAVMVFTGTRSAGEVRDALAEAEAKLLTQRWVLRQLLPEGALGR